MMILSLCNSCFQPYQLMVSAEEVELIRRIADEQGHTCPCPRLCGGAINLVGDEIIGQTHDDRRFKDAVKLSGKQLFQAVKGLGLPDEVEVLPEILGPMLMACKVTNYRLEKTFGKVYLSELMLDNGITIHLTSGPHGAQVLKLTKERAHGSGNPG